LQTAIKQLIKAKLVQSAHDVSDGGLFVTLVESAMPRKLGFDINTDDEFRKDAFLFGEAQSRVVVSVKKEDEDNFINFLMNQEVEFNCLGQVTDNELLIDEASFGTIADATAVYDNALGNLMN
jgi:phosphoribosylformylglycinamidine synthase subunit PurL